MSENRKRNIKRTLALSSIPVAVVGGHLLYTNWGGKYSIPEFNQNRYDNFRIPSTTDLLYEQLLSTDSSDSKPLEWRDYVAQGRIEEGRKHLELVNR